MLRLIFRGDELYLRDGVYLGTLTRDTLSEGGRSCSSERPLATTGDGHWDRPGRQSSTRSDRDDYEGLR